MRQMSIALFIGTPKRPNPHDNALRRSPRLREQSESGETNKRKARAIFGRVATTKVCLGLFLLLAMATNVSMPKHQTSTNLTFIEQAMNRYHKMNELYDGTLNSVHHFMYATGIAANDIFTFRNSMKQDDKMSFVEAMEKRK